MSRYLIRTYKLAVPVELNGVCEKLNREAARIYNKTMSLIRKTKDKKDFWLSEGAVQKYILRWYDGINIHTHSKQGIMQRYFQALRSYFVNVKSNPQAKPPYKQRRYVPFIWKSTAIKLLKDGRLRLSMRADAKPLEIQTNLAPDTVIKQVTLVYDSGRYYLHLAIEVESVEQDIGTGIMSVDLGILRPITCFDGSETVVYNGGILNSILRYRNKEYGKFQQMLSKCKKDSKRYKKLNRAKGKMLRKTSNQMKDIMHKFTSHFIWRCQQKGIGTIVLGDISNIRERVKANDNAKQKIHQWRFRKLTQMLECKAKLFSISVVKISEAYTSKTCPICDTQNKPEGRNYKCKTCGFEYHRDGVGAISIFKRYLGEIPVVAELAPAVGVRYNSHLRGHGVKMSPWKAVSNC